MKWTKVLLVSFLVSIAIWTLFSWPLPRHAFDAIPSSSQNVEKDQIRSMIPGDHLQLYYHFWLMSEMLSGRIPWFYNVYEFNAGDDAARRRPGAYYTPLSVVAAVLSWITDREFAWNSIIFLVIWLTYFCTWLLTQRLTSNEWIAGCSALVSITLPFLWVNLLGGSPAGFAMAWVPMMLLGIDMMARENRVGGGFLAGFALLFMRWGDAHVFFFSALAMPFWFLLCLINNPDFRWTDTASYRKLFAAALPLGVLLLGAVAYHFLRSHHIALSEAGGQRSVREASIFSPSLRGLVEQQTSGTVSHIYIGYVVLAILFIGGCILLFSARTPDLKMKYPRTTLVLILAAVAGVIALASATRGPFNGLVYVGARKLIPPYRMIRQPAKVFCLMPCILSIASAMVMVFLYKLMENRKFLRWAVPAVVVLVLTAELKLQVRPTICMLRDQQAAYKAVEKDALNTLAANEEYRPAAVVLPIWPGDSHFTSTYQHYASLYRIRLINGYSPVVPKEYVKNVFRRLESANQGILTDQQLNDLLFKNKIRYILLHEDLFPEKVSPFPVGNTLRNLLNHPRLKFLAKDGSVWAFRILEEPASEISSTDFMTYLFPARRLEFEQSTNLLASVVKDTDAGDDAYLSLSGTNAYVETAAVKTGHVPGLRWMVRVRGTARFNMVSYRDNMPGDRNTVDISSAGWTWRELPVRSSANFAPTKLRLSVASGTLDADLALLAGGKWQSPAPGMCVEIPAACFFHAGCISTNFATVQLRKADDPDAAVVYGPKLPLSRGRYEVELFFSSSAPAGTELGRLNMRRTDLEDKDWTPVIAGKAAKLQYLQTCNLPANILFFYCREADMEIHRMVITRME